MGMTGDAPEILQQPGTSVKEIEATGTVLIAAPVRGPFSRAPETETMYH